MHQFSDIPFPVFFPVPTKGILLMFSLGWMYLKITAMLVNLLDCDFTAADLYCYYC